MYFLLPFGVLTFVGTQRSHFQTFLLKPSGLETQKKERLRLSKN